MLEYRKVKRARSRHRRERLAVFDSEPVAADEFDLVVHHPVDIHHSLFADAANIDRLAAAAERIDCVHQQRARRAGAKTVDGRVNAVTTGERTSPLGDGTAFILRQNFDPVRGERFDAGETFAIAGGAENAGDATAERRQCRAQSEGPREAVDKNGLARSRLRLAERRIGGTDVTEPRRLLERNVVWNWYEIVLR